MSARRGMALLPGPRHRLQRPGSVRAHEVDVHATAALHQRAALAAQALGLVMLEDEALGVAEGLELALAVEHRGVQRLRARARGPADHALRKALHRQRCGEL